MIEKDTTSNNQNNTVISTSTSEKVDFRTWTITRYERRPYIKIMGFIYKENITI